MSISDLIGKKFGSITITGHDSRKYHCFGRCDCGKEKSFYVYNLMNGRISTCGVCQYHRSQVSRSGRYRGLAHAFPREYRTWQAMKMRCRDQRVKNYGGRGIKVCKRWQESFANFMEDMGPRPPKHSLDRFPDNNGNYEPRNCRWATAKEQCRNMNKNVIWTFNGKTQCMSAWAEELGVSRQKLERRFSLGWTIEKILTV